MIGVTTIAAFVSASVMFWMFVPLSRLVDGFPSLTVALSIMAAAVLVRLNRGMPTLDWKSLQPIERRRLTARIQLMTAGYLVVIATVGSL